MNSIVSSKKVRYITFRQGRISIANSADSLIDISCLLTILTFLPFFYSFSTPVCYGIKLAPCLLFLMGVSSRDKKLFLKMLILLSSFVLYTVIYFFHVTIINTSGYYTFWSKSILCYMYMMYGLYYSKHRVNTDNSYLGKWYLIVIIFTILTSLIGMHRYGGTAGGIIRGLGNGLQYEKSTTNMFYRNNICNWGLAYAIALSGIVYLKKFKQKIKPVLFLSLAIITLYFLVRAEITFALIFGVLDFVLAFLYAQSWKRKVIIGAVSIVALIVIGLNISNILYAIYTFFNDIHQSTLARRVWQLYVSSNTGALYGDGEARVDLYLTSITTFFKYPILGYKMTSTSDVFNVIGMHSHITDALGATGIIGTSLYFVPFFSIIRSIKLDIKDKMETYFFNCGLLLLVLFMVINPVHYSQETFFAVFCLPFLMNMNTSDKQYG